MLRVNNLKISSDKKILVNGIDFEIEKNQILSIIGQSGSGKSLTATAIMGLLPETLNKSGEIILNEKNIMQLKDKEIAKIRMKEMAMIYQNPFNCLVPVMTLEKQLKYIYKIQELPYDTNRIRTLMDEVSLPLEYLKKYSFELSGGELQRIVILMSMLFNPNLLICDEPTTALDSETGLKIINLIKNLKDEYGMSVLFISHDLQLAEIIADRVMIMQDGNIIERGDAKDIYNNPKQDYTKALLEASRF